MNLQTAVMPQKKKKTGYTWLLEHSRSEFAIVVLFLFCRMFYYRELKPVLCIAMGCVLYVARDSKNAFAERTKQRMHNHMIT